MKNVKVILISVVLCAAVFANSRIDALGGDAGFWAGDRANIGDFPATINDHDFVEIDGIGAGFDNFDDVGDPGTNGVCDTDCGVNATILWGDATTWGFNFNQDDDITWLNIMWGNGDVGLNVQYASDDNGATESDGFGVSYGQNFDWGELGVGFWSASIGGFDGSGYWANWRDDLDAWVFDSAKASFQANDWGSDVTDMYLSFDMFTHLDAGGADVLFGLGVEYETESVGDDSWTSMTLPTATLAVEAGLTDWATLRAFASHSYDFSCTNDGVAGGCSDDTTGPGDTSYGFGLGFDWGQASLDMNVGEQVFTNPVGTMTGWDGLDTVGEVTLSYSF